MRVALLLCCVLLNRSVVSESLRLRGDCRPPCTSVHADSPGKNTGEACHPLLRGNLSDPGIELGYPALEEGSLPGRPCSGDSVGKNPPANSGDKGLIPDGGRPACHGATI